MKEKISHDYVGLDILRILAMTGITIIHILATVDSMEEFQVCGLNGFLLLFLKILSRTSVILFSMISGYFLYNKAFKLSRITKLWSVVFSSDIVLLVIFLLFSPEVSKLESLTPVFLSSFFPLLTAHYWYILTYILLLAISPFLNKSLSALDQFHHQILCIAVGIFLCVIMELNPFINAQIYLGNSFGIIWMSYIYSVGAYIRKYDIPCKSLKKILAAAVLFAVCLRIVGPIIHMPFLFWRQFSESNNIVPLMMAIYFFCIFKNLDLKKSKLISYLSSISLYVYLFQQYGPFIRPLWDTLTINQYTTSPYLVLYILWDLLVIWCCGWLLSIVIKWLHIPVYKVASWVAAKLQVSWNHISAAAYEADNGTTK